MKFHNIKKDIELLSNKSRLDSLLKAVEILKSEGGVIIFLDSVNDEPNEMRGFGVGAQIIKHLGIENIKLLTTHAKREYVGIGGFGLNITKTQPL